MSNLLDTLSELVRLKPLIIDNLLEFRDELRKIGDYENADKIRDALNRVHIIVADSISGVSWKSKHWMEE